MSMSGDSMLCLFICLACLFCHWPSSILFAVHPLHLQHLQSDSGPPAFIVALTGKFEKKQPINYHDAGYCQLGS